MKANSDNSSIPVLGIPIFSRNEHAILEELEKYFSNQTNRESYKPKNKIYPYTIVTPNPEILVYAQKNLQFREVLNRADVRLPDGFGIVWAMGWETGNWKLETGKNKLRRITGVDFMATLCAFADRKGLQVGLIGGRRGVALEALECLKQRFPGLSGWAEDGPEIRIKNLELRIKRKDIKGIVETIQKQKTGIVFVALGYPKQEYCIAALNEALIAARYDKPIVLMAVGGAFDTIAGRIPRAPMWVQEHGLEWLFRLIRQPWRLKRQLALVEFVLRVLLAPRY